MTKGSSHLEIMLDDQMCLADLPPWETEFKAIEDRRFRWDRAWPGNRVLVEVQGAVWVKGGHSTGAGITRDAEKNNLAILAGWKPLIVTADHIKSGKALEWIKQALG